MKSGYIYKTTNMINNKIYIGKHEGEFNPKYYGSGISFRNSLKKYGRNNFKIEVVVYLPNREQLNEFEKFLIEKYREILGREKLYNITDGGDGFTGTHTKEAREKVSKTNLGVVRSQKFKDNLSKFWKGKKRGPQSEEHREKNKLGHLGNRHTEEVKKIISIASQKSNSIRRKEWYKWHKEECKCICCFYQRRRDLCQT